MTIKRLLILEVILAVGLGGVLFLPKVSNATPQGVKLSLPQFVGGWYGAEVKISDLELQMLAKDTEFARKIYTNGAGDQIFVSMVLSGHDLDNSIHRPERCLPAQGWSVADSRVINIATDPNGSRNLAVTRLHNVREVPTSTGRPVKVFNLNYYWFVGWKDSTPSHFQRTYIDIRDRILRGYNQRWAYITIASNVTKNLTRYGRDEKETDEMLQKFTREILPYFATDSRTANLSTLPNFESVEPSR